MRLFHLSLILCSVSLFGCSNAPEGFPKVVLCTVTVTDNGQPVSNASVIINTVPPTSGLVVSGETDEQGRTTIFTIFNGHSAPGAPVGSLVMTIFREPHVPDWKTEEELLQMDFNASMAYTMEKDARRARLPRIVSAALTNPNTSPLTIEAVVGQPLDWQVKLEEHR